MVDYLLKDDINATSLYKSIVFNVERRKASVALEESEKRYSDLFHLSPQPMWVYALEGFQFQDVNQAAINHYGYTREEFLGMKKDDICAKEDNRSAVEKPVALNNEENDMLDNCVMHQKKNGDIIQVELRSNTIEFQGKQSEIIIANDVTERFRYIKEIKDQNKKLNEIAWIQSHVVRAPLARILGLIDLITNHSTHANYNEELMGYLLDSAHELDKVIKDISDKTYAGQKGMG